MVKRNLQVGMNRVGGAAGSSSLPFEVRPALAVRVHAAQLPPSPVITLELFSSLIPKPLAASQPASRTRTCIIRTEEPVTGLRAHPNRKAKINSLRHPPLKYMIKSNLQVSRNCLGGAAGSSYLPCEARPGLAVRLHAAKFPPSAVTALELFSSLIPKPLAESQPASRTRTYIMRTEEPVTGLRARPAGKAKINSLRHPPLKYMIKRNLQVRFSLPAVRSAARRRFRLRAGQVFEQAAHRSRGRGNQQGAAPGTDPPSHRLSTGVRGASACSWLVCDRRVIL